MVTCRIKTATRRRGREGRGEGVEWWLEGNHPKQAGLTWPKKEIAGDYPCDFL